MRISRFTWLFSICWRLVLWAAVSPLHAQEGPYSFMHFGTEQGLSNDYITWVGKDPAGFLWVGTPLGLDRFDGRRIRNFRHDPRDSTGAGLPGNFVIAFTLGPDGKFWVSTDQGLCLLDPVRLQFEQVALPQPKDSLLTGKRVSKVVFDHQGRAWVSNHAVLFCLNPLNRRILKSFPLGGGAAGMIGLYIDRLDNIWVFADARLYRFEASSGRFLLYFLDEGRQQPMTVMDICEDQSGDLWFLSWGDGLFRYNRTTDRPERSPAAINLTRQIMPDVTPDGRRFFWIGGGRCGLFLYFPDQNIIQEFPNDKRDPFTHNGALPTHIYKDTLSDEVWIGTELGLEQYAPAAIRFGRAIIPEEPDFGPYNQVAGAAADLSDTLGKYYFIGVWANGFFRWNRHTGRFERFTHRQDVPILSDEVFNITVDRNGFLWLDMAQGIGRYDPRRRHIDNWKLDFRVAKRANKILCSTEDRQGNLWFGANADGLFRFNAKTQRPEHVALPAEVLSPNGDLFVRALAADSLGRVWIACNRGIIRYDPASGAARRLVIPGHPAIYESFGLTVAHNGRIWATLGQHLVELDSAGRLLRTLGPENGMRCNRSYSVVEDRLGQIWLTTDYLLHCFKPGDNSFSYYGASDGLFNNTPTDGLSILPNGEIIVGFQNAFNIFDPARLRRNTTPPPVVITAVRVLDQNRSPADPLLLYPGENMLTVEFAALNFSQPERNRYAYKLEGFNQDWIYTDRPVAVYTNLDGGHYTLRVKAANNDGVWNETGASLRFQVVPPFYRRWYFFLGLIVLVAGAVFGVARYRYLQRRRLELFRERLARDLHDEMGSTLSSIRFFSDFAQTQVVDTQPQTLPVLQRISQSATTLSESMQDIIWAMKTKEDHLDDIASRMTEFGLRLLEARGIRFKTNIDPHFPIRHLAPEQRRNLYLIFKEALNNAAKYAQCSEVELVFTAVRNELRLAVIDNGQGFDPTSDSAGNGLHNMRQRATEIGGQLQVHSAPGQGTRVELLLKW